jgi:hypothetical protein
MGANRSSRGVKNTYLAYLDSKASHGLPAPINFTAPVGYARQTVWYIDPVNGSDSFSGLTPATALGTFAEYVRRTGQALGRPITGAVDIFILNSLAPSDVVTFTGNLIGGGGTTAFLRIHGVPKTVHSGTVTAFTAYNQTTGTANDLQDGTLDWTPFVGMQVTFTTGVAAGARGNIIKAVSAGHARIDWITTANGTLDPSYVNPGPGDHYQVQTLPQVFAYEEDVTGVFIPDGLPHALVELLDFTPIEQMVTGTSPFTGIVFQYCAFSGLSTYGTTFLIVGTVINAGVGMTVSTGTQTLLACSFLNSGLLINTGYVPCSGVLFQNSIVVIQAGGELHCHNLGTGIGVFDTDSWLTFFDGDDTGTLSVEGLLWGSNNTTFLVALTSGARIVSDGAYTAKFPARCTGGATELQINGKTSLYANSRSFPFGLVNTLIPLTFANIVKSVATGGFEGLVYDPLSPITGFFTNGS